MILYMCSSEVLEMPDQRVRHHIPHQAKFLKINYRSPLTRCFFYCAFKQPSATPYQHMYLNSVRFDTQSESVKSLKHFFSRINLRFCACRSWGRNIKRQGVLDSNSDIEVAIVKTQKTPQMEFWRSGQNCDVGGHLLCLF